MAKRKTYHVEAHWDPQAKVWTSKSDVPGLVIETSTLAEFEALMHALVPEMIADNDGKSVQASIEWRSFGAFDLAAA
ncbi:MAG TPA: DUF1902 domain-containing protein [Caulobacteraceae bacterium]|nr:DUF1902 domain-containing protein [Caulobacteraceae bacterium]